jgi:hypothetical protein
LTYCRRAFATAKAGLTIPQTFRFRLCEVSEQIFCTCSRQFMARFVWSGCAFWFLKLGEERTWLMVPKSEAPKAHSHSLLPLRW